VLPGGQTLGVAQQYLETAGKAPGEIVTIGFDLSPPVLDAVENNWVQVTADPQPFLQGHMPIPSPSSQLASGLAPCTTYTRPGFVTPDNAADVKALVEAGKR